MVLVDVATRRQCHAAALWERRAARVSKVKSNFLLIKMQAVVVQQTLVMSKKPSHQINSNYLHFIIYIFLELK